MIINPTPNSYRNLICNGDFNFSQPGSGAQTFANAALSWTNIDMWAIKNSLGTNGVATITPNPQLGFGNLAYKISTAPTAAFGNAYVLAVFDDITLKELNSYNAQYFNGASIPLTIKCDLQSLGNVNNIKIQPIAGFTSYAIANLNTLDTNSPAQSFAVGLGSWTTISTTFNVFLTSGSYFIYGFAFFIGGVSSGNIYDLNNGFDIRRMQVNLDSQPSPWAPFGGSYDTDLARCRRFYQKSFEVGTNPPSTTDNGLVYAQVGKAPDAGGDNSAYTVKFPVPMIAAPTMSFWDAASNANTFSRFDASATRTNNTALSVTSSAADKVGFSRIFVATQNTAFVAQHYVADARP